MRSTAAVALRLAVDALAAHRLTRLLAADVILDRPREEVARRAYAAAGDRDAASGDPGDAPSGGWALYAQGDPDAPKLATLVTCRWCVSVYVAAGVVAARRFAPGAWRYASTGLALSSAAVLLSRLEDD